MGELLREGLERLQRRYPRSIGAGPGHGPHAGARARRGRDRRATARPARALTARVFEETKKRGLLIGKGGLEGNCFRIAPALNVGRTEIDEALALLEEAFATAGAR